VVVRVAAATVAAAGLSSPEQRASSSCRVPCLP